MKTENSKGKPTANPALSPALGSAPNDDTSQLKKEMDVTTQIYDALRSVPKDQRVKIVEMVCMFLNIHVPPDKCTPQSAVDSIASLVCCETHSEKEKQEYNTCPICLWHIHKAKCKECDALSKYKRRMEWLHDCSTGSTDAEGCEWGIYRVKWKDGRAVEVWQTNSDFSDLDAEMARQSNGSATKKNDNQLT